MTVETISAPGRPPRGACDCHVHVIDSRFPLPGTPPSAMRDAPATAYQAVQRALGLERTVLVQANAYGADNRCMLDAVQVLGPASTRAIAVVRPDATAGDITALADRGACGIRFHLLPGGYLTLDDLDGLAAHAADLGWHAQLQIDGRELAQILPRIERLPCPVVIDHIGKFLEPVAVEHPGFQALLRLLDQDRTWVKLSAGYEVSRSGPPRYDDVSVLARALVRHAPHRMVWASNWPHLSATTAPSDAGLLGLLADWASETAIRNMILVDNPAQLYGFQPVAPQ